MTCGSREVVVSRSPGSPCPGFEVWDWVQRNCRLLGGVPVDVLEQAGAAGVAGLRRNGQGRPGVDLVMSDLVSVERRCRADCPSRFGNDLPEIEIYLVTTRTTTVCCDRFVRMGPGRR